MTLLALDRLKTALSNRPEEIFAAKKKGRKVVGWMNYNIPEEIIHALDLIPVRLGAGGDARLVDIGSRYISTKNCVFLREMVGLFAENLDNYIKAVDLVAVDTTCLQTYRMAEVIEYYFKTKIVVLDIPRNLSTPDGLQFFNLELNHFVQNLEAFSGQKLDLSKLAESIELYNQIRNGVQELYKFQAVDNPLISWREVLDVLQSGNFLDKLQFLNLLRELLNELHQKQSDQVVKNPSAEIRLFLSGSQIPPGDTKLISIIESLGGRIVGDDLWSGLNQFLNVDIKQLDIEGIAGAYAFRVPHGALPYFDLENDRRLQNMLQLIRLFQAQAVIYHTLRYCDPYSFKANETKEILKKSGIPFLEIHTEYAGSDFEAIRTRVEAFVELIKNKNDLLQDG